MSSFASLSGALFYLRAMTLWGVVRSRAKRLRQPKYLFGALVGAAYFYFIFFRNTRGPPRGNMPGGVPVPEMSPETIALVTSLAAAGLLIVVLVSWLVSRRATLAFSEAEIAFLFPAPVSRRMLIHYRILSSQFRLILTALIFTLVFRRGITLEHALGWWVILATLNLHFTGSSFVTTRLFNRTLTSPRKRNITLVLVAAAVVTLIAWGWIAFVTPGTADLMSGDTVVHYIATQLERGPMPWLLAIPRLTIAPYMASSTHAFLFALGPALAVLIAHYFWVLRSEVSFEEAAVARAEKRAARVRAIQQGDWRTQGNTLKPQRPPFRLASTGRPELAFLWKNLFATVPVFRPVGLIVITVFVIGAASWLGHRPQLGGVRSVVTAMAAVFFVFMLLFGPQLARQDLRSDLKNADILKTYPLRGWQIVLGELLTPLFVLSVVNWLALLAAVIAAPGLQVEWPGAHLHALIALGAALLVPPFCAIQLLVPNAGAVIFPAWMQTVSNRGEHGLDVMGQRIIFMAGQLLVMAVALLPAAIVGGILFLLFQWLAGIIAGFIVAVVAVFAVLLVEIWIGIRLLGERFEVFDLSAELRP